MFNHLPSLFLIDVFKKKYKVYCSYDRYTAPFPLSSRKERKNKEKNYIPEFIIQPQDELV